MGPILSSLVELQAVETELRRMQQRLKQTQQILLKQQQQITQLQEALKAKHEEIKLVRMQHDKLELELKVREEDISKYRVALNTARTNKDYSAILTQINTRKADKSKLEDQIITLLNQIETDQSACGEIEADIEVQTQKLQEINQNVSSKQQKLQEDIDKLSKQQAAAAGQVPAKERSLFSRLAERYEGEVLAEVTKEGKRKNEHSCGGCYMKITLESVNALMTKDEVVICPNCGRILVLDKNPKQEATA